MEETVIVRMLTPPIMFWGLITDKQWGEMSDDRKDDIVNVAKKLHSEFDYSKVFE